VSKWLPVCQTQTNHGPNAKTGGLKENPSANMGLETAGNLFGNENQNTQGWE